MWCSVWPSRERRPRWPPCMALSICSRPLSLVSQSRLYDHVMLMQCLGRLWRKNRVKPTLMAFKYPFLAPVAYPRAGQYHKLMPMPALAVYGRRRPRDLPTASFKKVSISRAPVAISRADCKINLMPMPASGYLGRRRGCLYLLDRPAMISAAIASSTMNDLSVLWSFEVPITSCRAPWCLHTPETRIRHTVVIHDQAETDLRPYRERQPALSP